MTSQYDRSAVERGIDGRNEKKVVWASDRLPVATTGAGQPGAVSGPPVVAVLAGPGADRGCDPSPRLHRLL